jgi:spermidine synthase
MLPCQRPSSALILGLAGGTVAWALAQRFGSAVRIVGVDDDEAVLATAEDLGWLGLPNLAVLQTDAFAYVADCTERFSHVALDLYRAEHFVGRSLEKRFLRRLAELLLPGGEITVNLFDDLHLEKRMTRIVRVLDVEQRIQSGDNVVVHARRRR